MPERKNRQETDYEDAAQILRGYKERIEQLEETERGGDQTVQLFRSTADTCVCADSVSYSTGVAGGFSFGDSQFGFGEWGDG